MCETTHEHIPICFRPSKEELQEILEEIDEDGSGEIEFGEFCQVSPDSVSVPLMFW